VAGVLHVDGEGRRRRRKGRREKRKGKREKEKEKRKTKEKKKKIKRGLSAGFAVVVDARAQRLQSEATRTLNDEKGNTRTGIEFGCRNGGSSEKDFRESGAHIGKNLE
jgi:hypothetical protein